MLSTRAAPFANPCCCALAPQQGQQGQRGSESSRSRQADVSFDVLCSCTQSNVQNTTPSLFQLWQQEYEHSGFTGVSPCSVFRRVPGRAGPVQGFVCAEAALPQPPGNTPSGAGAAAGCVHKPGLRRGSLSPWGGDKVAPATCQPRVTGGALLGEGSKQTQCR